jgi:hypothetical protein
MRSIVNVLIIEENENYNIQLIKALKQSIHFIQQDERFQLVFHSFTDTTECISKIKSNALGVNDLIAFVDFNPEDDLTTNYIISLLKKQLNNTLIVLLSQTKSAEEHSNNTQHDYLVVKDKYAPALCRLYLDQIIDNKFL